MPTNDNGFEPYEQYPDSPSAHGHAALLLVESLLHALMERGVLTVPETLEIIQTAIEVQTDVADAADGAGTVMWRSHALLAAMATSLKRDTDGFDGHGR